jgi:hypothetical protein
MLKKRMSRLNNKNNRKNFSIHQMSCLKMLLEAIINKISNNGTKACKNRQAILIIISTMIKT